MESVCLVKRDLGFFNQVILEVVVASPTSSPVELRMWIVPLRSVCKCSDLRVVLLGGAGNLEEMGPTGCLRSLETCFQNVRMQVLLVSSAPQFLLGNLALTRGPKHQTAK